MRRRVGGAEFDAWVDALPGLALPPAASDPASAARPAPGAGPPAVPARAPLPVPVTLPVPVSVSLQAHAAARLSLVLRLEAPAWTLRVTVSVLAELAAGLARWEPRPGAPGQPDRGWAEVSLLPAAGARGEVLRWAPPSGHLPAAGPGTMLQVSVVAADDAVWRWFDAWQHQTAGWIRLPPQVGAHPPNRATGEGGAAVSAPVVRAQLEHALQRVLGRGEARHG